MGWGVLQSDDLPADVWAHYSAIEDMPGFRGLEAGERVRFSWEEADQDGYRLRAVAIYKLSARPGSKRSGAVPESADNGAFRTSLTIHFD